LKKTFWPIQAEAGLALKNNEPELSFRLIHERMNNY